MPRSSVPPSVLHAPPLGPLLKRFSAGSALSCEPVDEGLLNRGYRLSTTRGRFFLKHHFDPETAAPAAIVRQHRATQRLAELGVPVAPPLAGRDGDTVAVVGGHAYALHPWIEGRHRHGGQLTPGQCGRLGALLGVVHASLERVMPARQPAFPVVSSSAAPVEPMVPVRERLLQARRRIPRRAASAPRGAEAAAGGAGAVRDPGEALRDPGGAETPGSESADPVETFALIDALLDRVGRHRPADAFDALARHRLLERRELLERHARRRPPGGGPVGWVHGDFHPLNVLYRDDAPEVPAAILDWDRLGVRPRAEEAVRAAVIFFVRPVGALDLARVRSYARAYRRSAGAGPAELAAAVHRVWWERLNDFWMLRWHYERGDTRADPQFPAASALAVWWTREYDAVCEAFVE
ncbi:phosphotransferase [Streptomyces stelliscabiei]|uniref:Ser/Thr protein kinase RdoA (MazF antagonist) n=3 Tax=Streptomyces stelliscabiei TaxID=146820 RepID=A0A8I0TSD5_9ACTN|nr:phosphotransferase [Streptomyces stelliscabiei]MBE1598609.1 Ser/Thr protein kinase RdoA (MazF antagonist) [Streptomyces stelliscabiei]MDX2516598.1 phosphotransferase [Streptomyces stelliscabiei]